MTRYTFDPSDPRDRKAQADAAEKQAEREEYDRKAHEAWMAEGWDLDLAAHLRRGGRVLGICGGYQMLGTVVRDPDGIEGPPGESAGLGLLEVETTLGGSKRLELACGVELPSGERVSGTYRQSVRLVSSRYALVEHSREFTLVPWRPVIDKALGRQVSGLVRGSGVSWELGRKRGHGIGM